LNHIAIMRTLVIILAVILVLTSAAAQIPFPAPSRPADSPYAPDGSPIDNTSLPTDLAIGPVAAVSPGPDTGTTQNPPTISVFFRRDAVTPVDISSLVLILDGTDVTPMCLVNRQMMAYHPPMPLGAGKHTAEARGRDGTGEPFQVVWSFQLGADTLIKSIQVSPLYTLILGETLEVVMEGLPGGKATLDLGEWKTGLPMTQTSPGRYVFNYQVQHGDQALKVPVVVHLVMPQGNRATATAPNPASIFASMFTVHLLSPTKGELVGQQFVISGITRPNTRVSVEVDLEMDQGIWGMLGMRSKARGIETTSDAQGRFSQEYGLPFPMSGVKYTIRAYGKDETGMRSAPDMVEVRSK